MSKARKGKRGSKKARKRSKARAAKRGSSGPRPASDTPLMARAADPKLTRKKRLVLWALAAVVYVAVMWFLVFPWVDATFVNKPTL